MNIQRQERINELVWEAYGVINRLDDTITVKDIEWAVKEHKTNDVANALYNLHYNLTECSDRLCLCD